jgi:glycosyltransferase involved in cell wall biosynthesis
MPDVVMIFKCLPKIIPYGSTKIFSKGARYPDKTTFTVMQVGTISRYKNQAETIKAVADAKKVIPNIRLWLIGNVSEPDYKRALEDMVRLYGIGDIVHWEPHVTREHLRYLYSMTDVLMHPVKEQGGWLSPFEAISTGCPVIVSNELTCWI